MSLMGAFGYNNSVTTTSTSNWYTVTGSSTLGAYNGTVYGVPGPMWSQVKKAPKLLMEETRKWAENFCEKSPNYDKSLKGFSALASRVLYKSFLEEGYDENRLLFGYIHNQHCSHVFLIYDQQILDVCADHFGGDPTEPVKVGDIDIEETPWWDSSINYASQSGLIARQRRDGWPEHQVTLSAAKTKHLPKIQFSTTEETDLDQMRFMLPLDDTAETYLKKQSKSDGFKTNLAALMLHSDPEIAKLATKLACKVLG